jgi:hypothetical protein
MIEWLSSKVATSMAVLMIAASFTGLFSMQSDYYRTLELEDLADHITDLVTQVDLLSCEALVEVNWTSAMASHGLPREFHGEPYLIQFSKERPFVEWRGTRVAGMYFPSDVELLNDEGSELTLLEVVSTRGFLIESQASWSPWGLEHTISIAPLGWV